MTTESDLAGGWLAWPAGADVDWDGVYREQLPRVFNFFRYRFANDAVAEDLTSRTFEKAWGARRRYRRDRAGFATWLIRIARNVAIDYVRTERRHAPLDAAEDVPATGTPETESSAASDLARLEALVAALPAREQELVALKYGAGETNRAIATLTGISETNVGTILHRVVQTLREQW